ncbi:MAG: phosphoenolpyruvate carboxylase [Rickettsiales bacterium]|nr:phosphoenolpyruvate carboxylase [Rickettsiales bacterium]
MFNQARSASNRTRTLANGSNTASFNSFSRSNAEPNTTTQSPGLAAFRRFSTATRSAISTTPMQSFQSRQLRASFSTSLQTGATPLTQISKAIRVGNYKAIQEGVESFVKNALGDRYRSEKIVESDMKWTIASFLKQIHDFEKVKQGFSRNIDRAVRSKGDASSLSHDDKIKILESIAMNMHRDSLYPEFTQHPTDNKTPEYLESLHKVARGIEHLVRLSEQGKQGTQGFKRSLDATNSRIVGLKKYEKLGRAIPDKNLNNFQEGAKVFQARKTQFAILPELYTHFVSELSSKLALPPATISRYITPALKVNFKAATWVGGDVDGKPYPFNKPFAADQVERFVYTPQMTQTLIGTVDKLAQKYASDTRASRVLQETKTLIRSQKSASHISDYLRRKLGVTQYSEINAFRVQLESFGRNGKLTPFHRQGEEYLTDDKGNISKIERQRLKLAARRSTPNNPVIFRVSDSTENTVGLVDQMLKIAPNVNYALLCENPKTIRQHPEHIKEYLQVLRKHRKNVLEIFFGDSDSTKTGGLWISSDIDNNRRIIQDLVKQENRYRAANNMPELVCNIRRGNGTDIGRGGQKEEKVKGTRQGESTKWVGSEAYAKRKMLSALTSLPRSKGKTASALSPEEQKELNSLHTKLRNQGISQYKKANEADVILSMLVATTDQDILGHLNKGSRPPAKPVTSETGKPKISMRAIGFNNACALSGTNPIGAYWGVNVERSLSASQRNLLPSLYDKRRVVQDTLGKSLTLIMLRDEDLTRIFMKQNSAHPDIQNAEKKVSEIKGACYTSLRDMTYYFDITSQDRTRILGQLSTAQASQKDTYQTARQMLQSLVQAINANPETSQDYKTKCAGQLTAIDKFTAHRREVLPDLKKALGKGDKKSASNLVRKLIEAIPGVHPSISR